LSLAGLGHRAGRTVRGLTPFEARRSEGHIVASPVTRTGGIPVITDGCQCALKRHRVEIPQAVTHNRNC
jgi:hypothetical protein